MCKTPLSVGEVLTRYRQHQESEGNKPRSIETTGYRLRRFFAEPRLTVKRVCERVGVMKVPAHSMRGLFATLKLKSGVPLHEVAGSMGHEKPRTTAEHYAQPGAADEAPRARALNTLLPDQA